MLMLILKSLRRIAVLAAALFISFFCARADVALPALFSDNMVLQRDLPIHIWGKAAPGESVSVALRGDTRSTTANAIRAKIVPVSSRALNQMKRAFQQRTRAATLQNYGDIQNSEDSEGEVRG